MAGELGMEGWLVSLGWRSGGVAGEWRVWYYQIKRRHHMCWGIIHCYRSMLGDTVK